MGAAPLSLREQGFRFVFRNGRGQWLHPLEVQFHDVDCTDMDDDEFAAFLLSARRSDRAIEVGDNAGVPSFTELATREARHV